MEGLLILLLQMHPSTTLSLPLDLILLLQDRATTDPFLLYSRMQSLELASPLVCVPPLPLLRSSEILSCTCGGAECRQLATHLSLACCKAERQKLSDTRLRSVLQRLLSPE